MRSAALSVALVLATIGFGCGGSSGTCTTGCGGAEGGAPGGGGTAVGGVPLNGVPASACHLDVAVPAATIASPGQVQVVVSPGGWTLASAAATLTVH